MEWLVPNFEILSARFSSQIYFELHYDEACVATTNDESCFTMEMLFEGETFTFPSCQKANSGDLQFCAYSEFLTNYDAIRTPGDLDQACLAPFVPPPPKEQKPNSVPSDSHA